MDNVKKKLTIDNFGEKDKLFLEGDKYGYKALQELDGSLGKIEVNFQDEANNSNSNVASGFDFL